MANTDNNAKRTRLDQEEVKAAIVSHLEGLTANSTVAMGGIDHSIPNQPLLKIEGYGTLGLPVNKRVANELGQLMEEAPYGMGEDTVLDKKVRDTLQISPDKFQITNEKFSQAILTDVVNTVKMELGLQEMKVCPELYKLLLYKPGGHFKPHRDTEKADGMFGTLIVQLPSEFTGGDLVVRHAGKEIVVKMCQEGCSTSCLIAAHYSDCEHEVTPVLTGYRLALVYSLCWGGAGQAPSAEEVLDKATSLKPLLVAYIMESKNSARICWGLEHLYSDNAIKKGSAGVLKGKDRAVVEMLLNTNHMLEGEEQLEVFLAKAFKVRHEYGDCYTEGYKHGVSHTDSNCCFDYIDCDEIDTKLTDFIGLTGGEIDMEDETFKVKEEVLNYEDEREFWGEGKGECSGPSGNQGATRDMWYHKWVAVMWRKADALMIKLQASHVAGLQHILNTCQEGDMVKAKEEVEKVISKPLEKSVDKEVIEVALDLALAIEDEDICVSIVDKFLTNSLEMCEPMLAKLVSLITKYTWPVLRPTTMKLLEKADSISQVAGFAKLFSKVGITDVSACELVLLKMSAMKVEKAYSFLYSYNSKPTTANVISILDLVLMFPSDLVRLGKQLSRLPCMSTLDMTANISNYLATIMDSDQTGLPVVDAIEEKFLCQAGKEANLSQNSAAVTKMVNVMVKLNRESSVQAMSRIILGQPAHQFLLSDILSTVSAATVPMPAALLTLVRARVASLHPVVTRGPPAFTWRQSTAVVPGHPTVQQFFRGDQQHFTYRGFTGIKHSRKWVSKHTTGGQESKAHVVITKNKEAFNRLELKMYNQKLVEYQRLIACLPADSVPVKG